MTTPRRSKTITFSLPPEMEAQVRQVMKEDDLSVSELLRQGFACSWRNGSGADGSGWNGCAPARLSTRKRQGGEQ